jgi:hypothetical protein
VQGALIAPLLARTEEAARYLAECPSRRA